MMVLTMFAKTACQKITGTDCSTGLPAAHADSATLQHFLQVVFGIMAVVAVLIIVIAAFNIVIAQGDYNKVAKERGTIIYAAVGLVVAISAEVFVSFVLGQF